MKTSVAITVLILAVACGLGWKGQQRLDVSRTRHSKLVAEGALLGIAVDASDAKDPVHATKRLREDREKAAKAAAGEFIAFAREMEAMEKDGKPRDEVVQKRIMELMDRLLVLDGDQLKTLIAEVRAASDLKDETRQGLIAFSIMTLASDHPQAALAIFTESADLFKESFMREQVVGSALARWAKDDPMGALKWVRANEEKFPDLVTDNTKNLLIGGAAGQDPKLALQLVDELKCKEPATSLGTVVQAARTNDERTATLAALREWAAKRNMKEQVADAIGELAQSATGEGFAAGSAWLEQAGLSGTELEAAMHGVSHSIKGAESGQWIEWVGKSSLPQEKSRECIRDLAERWTKNDYQAAGQWLASAADGPAKQAAVGAYVETVFPYERDVAQQWIDTLPAGEDRAHASERCYQLWPRETDADKAAAEAFAAKYGITR